MMKLFDCAFAAIQSEEDFLQFNGIMESVITFKQRLQLT